MQCRKEEAAPAVDFVGDDMAGGDLPGERALDEARRHLQQRFRERDEFVDRQAAMPIIHRLGERMRDAGAHAHHRGLVDTEPHRDLVGALETDAADIAREPVRILRYQPDRIGTVELVDAHRARGADAVIMQEQHDLADRALRRPVRRDLLGALGADAGHAPQPARVVLDDLEDRIAEGRDELFRVYRPNTPDHPRAEIFLDRCRARRRRGLQEGGPELQTVGTVIGPAAAGLHEFAGRNQRRVADDRDRLAAAARLDPQHAEAGLPAMKHDPFDEPGENLAVLARLGYRPRHPLMMARQRSRGYRMSWESGASSPLATTLILIGA